MTKRFYCPRHWTLAQRLQHSSMPEPNSGCILWMGSVIKEGYGNLRWGGRVQLAHRLAWEEANGIPAPLNMLVCHKCDVPSCINPAHLFLGTDADNNADKMRKGRGVNHRGAAHGKALVKSDAEAMKIFRSVGRHTEIAARYGIGPWTVASIKKKQTWKHIHC